MNQAERLRRARENYDPSKPKTVMALEAALIQERAKRREELRADMREILCLFKDGLLPLETTLTHLLDAVKKGD